MKLTAVSNSDLSLEDRKEDKFDVQKYICNVLLAKHKQKHSGVRVSLKVKIIVKNIASNLR